MTNSVKLDSSFQHHVPYDFPAIHLFPDDVKEETKEQERSSPYKQERSFSYKKSWNDSPAQRTGEAQTKITTSPTKKQASPNLNRSMQSAGLFQSPSPRGRIPQTRNYEIPIRKSDVDQRIQEVKKKSKCRCFGPFKFTKKG